MGGAPRGAGNYSLLGTGAHRPRGEESYASEIICRGDGVGGRGRNGLPGPAAGSGGEQPSASGYKVLEPIRHGSLTVFPVVAPKSYATGEFLTLDEGLRTGEVVVTEYGNVRGLIRRGVTPAGAAQNAEVNRLVLVNNSKRPLLLLAGEIVTGGKQDRVIGKDRIVPAESDPVDLSVFCVEPGRWVGNQRALRNVGGNLRQRKRRWRRQRERSSSEHAHGPAFGARQSHGRQGSEPGLGGGEKAASIDGGRSSRSGATCEFGEIQSTTSYARVMENKDVKQKVDEIAAPIQHNYESLIKQLRDRKAVGVVVAVNGHIIWADIFASTDLLEKYWPKLVRSYASEAVVTRAKGGEASTAQAEAFLGNMEGRKETIESEPGVYRHTEVNGDGFKAFALTSLLPKTGFDVHVAKMAE